MSDPGPRRGGSQRIPRPADWQPGAPAPWPPTSTGLDVAALSAALAGGGLREPDDPADFSHPLRPADSRASSVLALFADGPRGAEVLLTRRSQSLRSHRGEMSFPGGRVDPGEDYVAAALREANEEVGLPPAAVTVLGSLEPISTWVSRSWIVPVIGVAADGADAWRHLAPASDEVDRVLWVPVAELCAPDAYREERWHTDRGLISVTFFELDDETVWGATARVLRAVLSASFGVS